MTQQRRRMRIAGTEYEVLFEPADGSVVDAYRTRYAPSPYLEPMLGRGPRSATVRITPE